MIYKRLETNDEKMTAYRLRFRVYCLERGFFDADNYPDQYETDEYDSCSVHFGALDERGALCSSMRLIQHNLLDFPIRQHFEWTDLPHDYDPHRAVELSRLVSLKNYPNMTDINFDIYGIAYRWSVRNGIRFWLAIMEKSLISVFRFLGVPFTPLGPPHDHTNVLSYPMCVSLDALAAGMSEKRPERWRQLSRGLEPCYMRMLLMPKSA